MAKVTFVPKPAFPSKNNQAQDEDEEEEYDMASHSTEDPVYPTPQFARCFKATDPYADSLRQSETGSTGLPDCGDSIDPLTFEQILEMDDDEDEREFSKSIVYGFFEQAEATFDKMETSLYVEISFASTSTSSIPLLTLTFICSSEQASNMVPGRPLRAKNFSK